MPLVSSAYSNSFLKCDIAALHLIEVAKDGRLPDMDDENIFLPILERAFNAVPDRTPDALREMRDRAKQAIAEMDGFTEIQAANYVAMIDEAAATIEKGFSSCTTPQRETIDPQIAILEKLEKYLMGS